MAILVIQCEEKHIKHFELHTSNRKGQEFRKADGGGGGEGRGGAV